MRKTALVLSLFMSVSVLSAQRPTDPNSRGRPRSFGDTQRITGRVVLQAGQGRIPTATTVTLWAYGTDRAGVQMIPPTGLFDFRGVPVGQHTLEVKSPSHEPLTKQVDVGQTFGVYALLSLGEPLDTGDQPPLTEERTVPAILLKAPKKAIREMEKAAEESKKSKPQKAIQHLKNALEIYPDLYPAYNSLAHEYQKLGRKAEAIKALEKSIQVYEANPDAYHILGTIYLRDGDYQNSLTYLRKAYNWNPDDVATRVLLSYNYLALGQYQLALVLVQQMAAANPDNTEVHFLIGRSQFQLGRYEDAKRHFVLFLDLESQGERAQEVRSLMRQIPAS